MKLKNIKINRKADTKLLSIWWFLVLTIIGVGIIIGTMVFFSKNIDLRAQEAEILSVRLIGCLAPEGKLLDLSTIDIYTICGLNKQIIDASGDYFISIKSFNSAGKEIGPEALEAIGNNAFIDDCAIGNSMIMASNYPRCIERNAWVLNENGQRIKLNVLVGDNYGKRPS